MPSYKLNLAMVNNCPPALTIKGALEAFGRPSDRDFGVLMVGDVIDSTLKFEVFRTGTINVPRVEKKDGSVLSPAVPKDECHEAMIRLATQDLGVLEVYSGSARSIEKVGNVLKSLELADHDPITASIPIDIFSALCKIRDDATTKTFQVVSARIKNYQDPHEDQVTGTYTVRFDKKMSIEAVMAFLEDQADKIESCRVKFKPDFTKKPVSVTLRPTAFFTLQCNDADETRVKNICRKLAGVMNNAVSAQTATTSAPLNTLVS